MSPRGFSTLIDFRHVGRRSARVQAKHALLEQVGAAGYPTGGRKTRGHPSRTVSHRHPFSHLRVQPRRRKLLRRQTGSTPDYLDAPCDLERSRP
jgi:hypothetical protein